MEDILDTEAPVVFDNSITRYEMRTYRPYATSTYRNNDAIHIAIQHQDQCLLPARSFIRIQGKLRQRPDANPGANLKLINNGVLFLFSEIRYELNAQVIDRCTNVDISSTMKGYPTFTPSQEKNLENAGWFLDETNIITDAAGNFEFMIPLSMIFGIAEFYKKIIVNMRHDLIFIRSNVDGNATMRTGAEAIEATISIDTIEWIVPTVILFEREKVNLLKFIEKDPFIKVWFLKRELFYHPLLPTSTRHVWTVKTATQMEKPRYVIVGFQTNRDNVATRNASHFDHVNLTNIRLYLN